MHFVDAKGILTGGDSSIWDEEPDLHAFHQAVPDRKNDRRRPAEHPGQPDRPADA